jgi:beta-lactam-binding protein with PASTA domain
MRGSRCRSLRLCPPRLSSILALLLGLILCASPLFADVADPAVHMGDVPRMIAQNATSRVPIFRKSVEPDVRQRALGATTSATHLTAVPDFRRHTVTGARGMAQNAGLGLEQGNVSARDEGRALVVAQSPKAGALVRKGTIVRVVAEIRGTTVTIPEFPDRVPPVRPPLRPAPSLVKETLYAAKKIAAHEGFGVGVEGGEPADESRAVVVRQEPIAGTRLPLKSTIRVQVRETLQPPPATPPVPEFPPPSRYVPVPDLVNRTLLDARRLIARTGLTLDASRFPPEEERRRIVVDQKPLPETPVPIGTSVSVKIARPSSSVEPPSAGVVAPPTTPTVPPTTAPSLPSFEPPMSTRPPIRTPPPSSRVVEPRPQPPDRSPLVRVPAPIHNALEEAERPLMARELTPRLPGWVVITIIATAAGIVVGAGAVLAIRGRTRAGPREVGPSPDLRIAVSNDGWQQEEPADAPILDAPALRLRVRSESCVEPVDTDFPIVAQEVKRHG